MITKIDDLNHEMATLIESLKENSVLPDTASEMNKTFSNMIRACQIQINYAQARGVKPDLDFLNQPVVMKVAM